LALLDKQKYPDIIQAYGNHSYYTNSTQLPVGYSDDPFEILELQDSLQPKYSGGTIQHIFLGEAITDIVVIREMVRKISRNFRLPYFTLTPTFSICPNHGYISGEHLKCSVCNAETEVWSRVVGYLRPVKLWNRGKQTEYGDRKPIILR
jgi:ribonucleoside-triphosphate reductase